MRMLIFGATGMVGRGVLRECLLEAEVESVVTIRRAPTCVVHPKPRELVRASPANYGDIEGELRDSTGVSSVFGYPWQAWTSRNMSA
jgi:uncharacterized protein YbjT (DUF2867 family)